MDLATSYLADNTRFVLKWTLQLVLDRLLV